MIFNSLAFWTLVAGLLAFVAKFFFPAFPLDQAAVLSAVLFFLGLVGITPQVKAFGLAGADILHSLAFWTMIAGLVAFVVHYFAPAFPLDQAGILAVIVFVLMQFGIKPELQVKGLLY